MSAHPIAIKRDTYDPVSSKVEAIWAGRKRGKTVISGGKLWLTPPRRLHGENLTLDELLAVADTRYGPTWYCRWDGTNLQVNRKFPLDIQCQPQKSIWLQQVLEKLPNVPDGYDGWYYRAGA